MINTTFIFSSVFAMCAMTGMAFAQSSGSGLQIETSGSLRVGGSSYVVPSLGICDGAIYQWAHSVGGTSCTKV